MTGYQGERPRAICPACGQVVTVKTRNRAGDRALREPLISQHRVPGSGRPTTRAHCTGSGTVAS